jgi:hypothetical protein
VPRLPIVLSLALAGTAQASIFFTQPGNPGDNSYPDAPTRHYSIEEDGTGFVQLPDIEVGGVGTAVSAIALAPDGSMVGFEYVLGQGSRPIAIDPTTGVATLLGPGTFVPQDVTGAAFDPDGTLWVIDVDNLVVDTFDTATGTFGGTPIDLPLFTQPINGGDLAFDHLGNCFMAVSTVINGLSALYTCDLDDGSFELVDTFTQTGFVDNTPTQLSTAGLAFSLSPETCEPVMMVSDGLNVDEIGIVTPGTAEATWVGGPRDQHLVVEPARSRRLRVRGAGARLPRQLRGA